MYNLQTSINIDGAIFNITNNGDFRMVLDCFEALNDEELSEDYRVLASLLIFYNEFSDVDDLPNDAQILKRLVHEMYKFFNCGKEQSVGQETKKPVIDWTGDSDIVCAAINNVAHSEIRALPYLHWWTFMGYYLSVGESVLSTVVSIRDKINRGKKLEKWEQEFKRNNPGYFVWKNTSVEAREAEQRILEMWNSGG